MNLKIIGASFVLGLLLSAYVTKTYFPTKQVEEKIVNVVKKDIVTVTKTIIKKDGTSETVTVTEDKSTEKATKSVSKTDKIESFKLGLSASVQSYGDTPTYGILAEKRIFGPIWLGLQLDTSKQVGVVLSYTF